MSIEIQMKITQEITFNAWIQEGSKSIAHLLQLPNVPLLHMEELKFGKPQIVRMDDILRENLVLLIHFEGYEDDKISVTTAKLDMMPPYISGIEAGIWCEVSVEGGREPIQFVLAAGIAHALAKMNGTELIDEVGFWSSERQSGADIFQNQLMLIRKSEDFQEAVNTFYSSLPGKQ
jgi:hypothetical protein